MSAITKATTEDDEMLVEYHLDYSKSQPNRFIQETGQRAILLDADVDECSPILIRSMKCYDL